MRDREQTLAANTVVSEQVTSPSPPSGLSEKARGKLRARSPSVGSLATPALAANTTILGYESASGFVATEEWVQSWVSGLPLDSILIAASEVSLLYLHRTSFNFPLFAAPAQDSSIQGSFECGLFSCVGHAGRDSTTCSTNYFKAFPMDGSKRSMAG